MKAMKRSSLGWENSLFVLPFDHRAAFAEMVSDVPTAKRVVYEGFLKAVDSIDSKSAGILVDEEAGADILKDARSQGYITACPAEKSGQMEFQFEYGDDFSVHLDQVGPTFVKVLVRYNPEGDAEVNQRQGKRLARLSEDCDQSGRRMMFELLVPATDLQMKKSNGDRKKYDLETRPALTVQAMKELQAAGVEPDIWKLEGVEDSSAFDSFVHTARRKGGKRSREDVGIIVLGRGETLDTVHQWIDACAGRPGATGIAVGRTLWEEPVRAFAAGKLARKDAAQEIGKRFSELCTYWQTKSSRKH
jgi:myo-inositol catabolism protein IolC